MKIVKLTAENVKKIRAVEITPTGALVEITGENGSGKTSVLDSIWWALAGTKHIQAVPIRNGEKKARIKLDLGELVIERKFSESGSTLTVESADGARFPSPQTMLDKLLGALSFDPLAFVSQDPKQQFDSLRSIIKLDVDIDKLDAMNKSDYDKRTDINRDAKSLRAQADGVRVPPNLPQLPIDVSALKDRITNAATVNGKIESEALRRKGVLQECERLRVEVAKKRQEAKRLLAEAGDLDTKISANETGVAALPAIGTSIDVSAVRAELDTAETVNRGIEARNRYEQLAEKAKEAENAADRLTATMEARKTEKAAAIARAKMPVDGLGFGDGVVTFGGIPFEQASTGEQLKTSVALAMAANPKLRVIRIKEGSMLDAKNLAMIAGMAKDNDYQIWIERVDSTGKVGIVIEDGSVVAVN